MFDEISGWLDDVLKDISDTGIPNAVIAFGFNLYDNGDDNWSMELIGTSEFDTDEEDWLCNEVTDFATRDNPFQWCKKAEWEEILNDVTCLLKRYLESGKYAAGTLFRKGRIKIAGAAPYYTPGECICGGYAEREIRRSRNRRKKR